MGRRILRLFGVIAPVFFAIGVAVLGFMKPGYSHVYNTMSELGEIGSVTGVAASLLFIVSGLMIAGFGYELHMSLAGGDRRVWSGVLVILYGLLDFVGSGVFPVDAGGASITLVATVHVYATLIGELAAVGMPIWFIKDTEGHDEWDRYRGFSRVVFWLSMPLVAFLGYCIVGHVPGVFDTPIGLAQRLLVGVFLVWISVTGFRLLESDVI